MKCLCLYAQEFEHFRLEELHAICSLFSINIKIDLRSYLVHKPYLIVDIACEKDVHKILSRSVLMKSISQLFIDVDSLSAIHDCDTRWKQEITSLFTDKKETFKFEVEVFNKKMTLDDKITYIEDIQKYMSIPGEVDLKRPDVIFSMMLDFDDDKLRHIYLGKLLGLSQRTAIYKYNLKTRYFIGNTSMDPQLAMIMANLAQVEKGSFCYDPFVGTGSIILACSHFGAYSGGSDIDYNIIYGRGKSSRAGNKNFRARDEIIRTNFDNYQLGAVYWDVLAADATNSPLHAREIFDAVVTDPPYGIREGGRKLGSKKDTTWDIPEDVRDEHIPAKKLHALSRIIIDLFEFAFKYLRKGGRLVYWLPVYKPTYSEDMIPTHPAFEPVSNCEQNLTKTISRRLITMNKTKSITEVDALSLANHNNTISEGWIDEQNNFRDNYFMGRKNGDPEQ